VDFKLHLLQLKAKAYSNNEPSNKLSART